jgi:hypothetical protein
MRFFWLFFLLLVGVTWADNWTHQGPTWRHQNGLQITFPQDFAVSTDEFDNLSVVGKQGFVRFTVQAAKGEKEFKGWIAGREKVVTEQGMTPKREFERKMAGGVVARYSECERMSEEDILFVVLWAAFQQGQDYLCLQLFYPKQRESDWGPLLEKSLESVKRVPTGKPAAKSKVGAL